MPTTIVQPAGATSYKIVIVGARRWKPRDLYLALLEISWSWALLLLGASYLAIIALFALAFMTSDGVANARPHSFFDAFFFSAQTLSTVGYGSMYPNTPAANFFSVVEMFVGLLFTALSTGLVFVRFSLTKRSVIFSKRVAIGPMNGKPTLMIRVGNDRSNQVFDAQFRLMLMKASTTAEGNKMYLTTDLLLVRDRASALSRSWSVIHVIDEKSPLHGETPESLAAAEAELTVTVAGLDETSLQPVYGRRVYEMTNVVWGARLCDVLTDLPNGDIQIDLSRFDEIEPTQPLPQFPYPRSAQPVSSKPSS
jgi:inward rectifier potassium channel